MTELVVTPEQYRDGYHCHPHVRLGENVIRFESRPFKLIRKLDDGNYLVEDPHEPDLLPL